MEKRQLFILVAVVAAALGVLLVVAPQVSQADPADRVIIDGLTDEQTVSQSGVGSTFGYTTGTNLIGGEREVTATVTAVGTAPLFSIDINGGQLNHSQGSQMYAQSIYVWDGSSDTGSPGLDFPGLDGEDLTNSGGNNAIVIGVINADTNVTATITLYNGSESTCSEQSRVLPDTGTSDTPVAVVFAFDDFAQGSGCSASANVNDVDAIKLVIDGTGVDDADITFTFITAGLLEYGDLPGGQGGAPDYNMTLYADNGAAHFIQSPLMLGDLIDDETDGAEEQYAGRTSGGDDGNGVDDHDGVIRTSGVNWAQGKGGGSIDVEVHGDGCLVGWIDWNQDGNFSYQVFGTIYAWDTNEHIISNTAVTTGTYTYTFTVPVDPADDAFYARFRLVPRNASNGCEVSTFHTFGSIQPNGYYAGGEVEDYYWPFGTNAVTLSVLDTQVLDQRVVIGIALLAVVGMAARAVLLARRRNET